MIGSAQRRYSDIDPSQQIEPKSSMRRLLSSTNTIKLMKSKLSILESTLYIIEEAIISVKYSSNYATKLNARIQISQYVRNLNIQNDYIKPFQL